MDRWTERLSDYIDHEMDAPERAALEAHLEQCADCRVALAELQLVVARASALEDAPPANNLWPGIERQIRSAAHADEDTAAKHLRHARRYVSLTIPQLAAAATVLVVLGGSAVWLGLRPPAQPSPAADTGQAAPVHTTVVASNAAPYDSAIAELQATLLATRDRLDPETVAVLERNLALIDAAILQSRDVLRRDPGNAYVSSHLDRTLRTKMDMLRRATTAVRRET
jgi:anti-sigma factor RsiW